MADNWMDDREREERDLRRADYVGRWPERGSGQYRDSARGEGRSFGARTYQGDGGYEGGRDQVFGEDGGGGGPRGYAGPVRGWQNPDYAGVSPAMRQGEYAAQRPRFSSQDYTRGQGGGRFYGDDDRERVYREEYGEGGYDPGFSPTRAAYYGQGYGAPGYGGYRDRLTRPASGGTGGYDYERGYGDGGRGQSRGERFERAGHDAGDFLHRAGEKVAAWFAGGGEGRAYEPDFDGAIRGHRGKGPKGYKRSDERINEDAHERLTDDAWLDASDINVAVSGGEVTLSGKVETSQAKHRAERIVEHINGVTHVQNNLRIGSGYASDTGLRQDDPVANGTGGAGAGQSTAGRKN